MERARRAGLLLRVEGGLRFVPAAVAVHIAPPPRITPVPGAPPELLGIAQGAGVVVPVLGVGPLRAEMLVCTWGGQLVGVVGGRVVQSGAFEVVPDRPDTVEYRGERAPPLDLSALCARVHANRRIS